MSILDELEELQKMMGMESLSSLTTIGVGKLTTIVKTAKELHKILEIFQEKWFLAIWCRIISPDKATTYFLPCSMEFNLSDKTWEWWHEWEEYSLEQFITKIQELC